MAVRKGDRRKFAMKVLDFGTGGSREQKREQEQLLVNIQSNLSYIALDICLSI